MTLKEVLLHPRVLVTCTAFYYYINTIIILKIIVCGGTIDSSIKGKLELPVGNLTTFFCPWTFTNNNGTMVIIANFQIKESKISCRDDFLLIAVNGMY